MLLLPAEANTIHNCCPTLLNSTAGLVSYNDSSSTTTTEDTTKATAVALGSTRRKRGSPTAPTKTSSFHSLPMPIPTIAIVAVAIKEPISR